MADIDPGGVQVAASPSGVQESGPTENAGLQLAASLRDVSPQVNDLVGQLGDQLKAQATAKAQQDVLKGSAKSYSDAVKSGAIPAGQNPWYVQAYNQDATKVSTQEQGAQIVAQSQTWPERSLNDGGAAYEARLNKAFGDLHQGSNTTAMNPIDYDKGFQMGAAPLIQGALQANHAYNITRITQEGEQVASANMSTTIQSAYKANMSPADILKTTDQARAEYIATGHTDAQANQLVFQGIRSAAGALMDPGVLKIADEPYTNGKPLSSQFDLNGNPNSDIIARDTFDISRRVDFMAQQSSKLANAQVQQEGQKFRDLVVKQFGFASDKQPPEVLRNLAEQNGISYEGFLAGAGQLNKEIEGITGLNKTLVANNENDPAVTKRLIDYHDEAATKGLTQGLVGRLENDVALGNVRREDAISVISQGASTVHTQFSEGMANKRESESEQRADVRDAQNRINNAKSQIKDYVDQSADGIVHTAETTGDRFFQGQAGSTNAATIHRRLNGAMGSYRLAHPDDVAGAQAAVQDEANKILNERLVARSKHQTTQTAGGLTQKGN